MTASRLQQASADYFIFILCFRLFRLSVFALFLLFFVVILLAFFVVTSISITTSISIIIVNLIIAGLQDATLGFDLFIRFLLIVVHLLVRILLELLQSIFFLYLEHLNGWSVSVELGPGSSRTEVSTRV